MTEGPLARGTRLLLRLAIGLVLLATGAGKLLDLRGFARVLATYEAFPDGLVLPLAVAIPGAELLLAAWLFSGRRLAVAALAAASMHLFYGGWALVTLLRGVEVPNCGCFGVFLARPLSWGTVLEDSIMVAASLGLAALARGAR